MIRSLLWKDFRVAAPAFLTAGLLFSTSFLSTFLLSQSMSVGPFPWIEATVASAHFCQWSMVIVAALLGGGIFAAEKEDGSICFFRSLPLSHRDSILSKLVVVLLAFECFWVLIALLLHISVPFAAMGVRDRVPAPAGMVTIAAISFSVLGLSWCWSAMLSKPILAALSGLLTSVLVLSAFAILRRLATAQPLAELGDLTLWGWLLGGAGLTVGTMVALTGREERTGLREQHGADVARFHLVTEGLNAVPEAQRGTFATLVQKDFRLAKAILIGGVVLLAVPYLYPLAAHSRDDLFVELLARGSTQSLWLSCVVFALWGGYIVSVERASKSDRFLQSLPVTLGAIARSRLMLTFLPATIVFIVNVSAMLMLHTLTFRESPVEEPVGGLLRMTWTLLVWQDNSLMFGLPALGMPLLCYGVGWFGAAALDKPFLGIGLGASASGLVLVFWLAFITLARDALLPVPYALVFLIAGVVASLVFVALGYRKMSGLEVA